MWFFQLVLAALFSAGAAAIMSYISMATGIGPWIETTLVLIGMLFFAFLRQVLDQKARQKSLGRVVSAGGIAGIAATACGFTFPTLYFLDPESFNQLMSTPLTFVGTLGAITLAAGSFGLLSAHFAAPSLLAREDLTFPIGELTFKMIKAADDLSKAIMLAVGFVSTQAALFLQSIIPIASRPLVLTAGITRGVFSLPHIVVPLDQMPMFLAIGFITGHVIAFPLFFGLLTKLVIIDPLHAVYPLLFSVTNLAVPSLSHVDFTIAFCSGLVLYGAIKGFLSFPRFVLSSFQKLHMQGMSAFLLPQRVSWLLISLVLGGNCVILYLLTFSFLAQLYLLIFSAACMYQLMIIAGKFGLAPLGRFATFVMVPGLLFFGYTPLQTTCVALYVEVAGGVACDALFGKKMAALLEVEQDSVERYQWLGLLICVLVIGIFFYLYIRHFGLGIEPGALAATRAAGRALLVSIKSFDVGALLFGLLFGALISFFKVNTALLLGGILMPIGYTLMLVSGGLLTYACQDKEDYYPFWSGVFASNSLWMLLRTFIV